MSKTFQSHIVIIQAPTLSAPFETIEDCKDDAPERALLWLTPDGTYQHSACPETVNNPRSLRALVYGVCEVADLQLTEWRVGCEWQMWQG